MRVIPFDALDGSDLHVDALYQGGRAGNSGDDPWHFITSPADALNILAVGAVHASGEHAAFSGFGPTSDGRTKPEVMALGADTPYARHDTTIGQWRPWLVICES